MPKTFRNFVLGIFAAVIFLYPLVPYYHGIVLGVVSVPIYILYILIDEEARGRFYQGIRDFNNSTTSLSIGLIFIWTFLSATWSLGPMDSLGIAIIYLFLTTLFFIVKYEFNEEWMRKLFLAVYYIAVIMVTGLLFWQFIQTRIEGIPFDRVSNIATLENVNNLAVFCVMGFFQSIAVIFSKVKFEKKIRYIILAFLCGTGVLLALSRAVLLILIIGLYLFALHKNKKLIWLMVFFSIVGVSVPKIRHRALDVFSYEQNVERVKIWKTSIDVTREFPLGGTGASGYRFAYVEYKEHHPELFNGWDIPVVWHAHNMFLRFSSELGIPGLLMIIAVVFGSIKTSKSIKEYEGATVEQHATYEGINMGLIAFYCANLVDSYFMAPKVLVAFYFILCIQQSFAYTHKLNS